MRNQDATEGFWHFRFIRVPRASRYELPHPLPLGTLLRQLVKREQLHRVILTAVTRCNGLSTLLLVLSSVPCRACSVFLVVACPQFIECEVSFVESGRGYQILMIVAFA